MPILERDGFLAQLHRAAQEVHDGRGVTAAVCGEAGIGKTTLVSRFADEARSEMRVLWSGCEALFTPRPLGPLFDLADALGPEVDALLGESQQRERLFPAVLDALQATAPALLVVEDVHWADHATLDLLKYLVRRIARAPVLLVLTYRDDEVSAEHFVLTLIGETPGCRRLALPRLSPDGVAALAQPARRDAREVYALTGGNPFYVTELLAGDDDGVPPTVRDAVLARAAKLSPAARAIVEVAATVPGKAERWLIDAALHPSVDALVEATTSGIVSQFGDALLFRHELGRRAIEDAMPVIRRQSLHANVLGLLQQHGGVSAARLAHHAAEAGDAGAILRLSPLAAEEAIRADAHQEAAAHYRRVLVHAGALGDRERAELLDQLSYECYMIHFEEEALRHRQAALALWRTLGDRLREGDTLRWIARLQWFSGRSAEARAAVNDAIAALETLPPGRELAMAWSTRAQLHMLAEEMDEAVEWGTRAIELAQRLGDYSTLAHALNNVGRREESLRIALEHGYSEHASRAYTNLSTIAVRELDYARAERYLNEGIAYAADREVGACHIYMLAWRARMHLERGNWSAAAEDAHAVLAFRGGHAVSRVPALTVLGTIRTRRGDENGMQLLDEARELAWRTSEIQRIAPVAAARAEAAWLRGEREAIVAEVQEAFDVAPRHVPWMRGELALYLWRGGALDTAPEDIAAPYALQIQGDWRAAAAEWERLGRPWERAAALADSTDADDLRLALDILKPLGDSALSARITQRLPRPRASTRGNPHGLTAREMDILALLAEGLRNSDIAARLFISTKTVGHHVSAVLEKLDARTRGEAAAKYRNL